MDTLFQTGVQWILSIQAMGSGLLLPMKILSFLGSENFFIFALPILYWSVDSALGLRVGAILLFTGGVNNLLKLTFHLPRPYWYSADVQAFSAESSFGLPSGHAQIAMVVWGTIAGYFRRAWGWVAAMLLVFLIGFSRLYLGVHFPHDVFVGWLVGGIILWIFLRYWEDMAAWGNRHSLKEQILAAFLLSMGFVLLGAAAYSRLAAWTLPRIWLENASHAETLPDPVTLKGLLTPAGALFGFLAGAAWMETKGGFQASGSFWQRAARYLVGLLGVVVIYVGLKLLFPQGETWIAYTFRFLRYALLGVWISGGAPYVFGKLQLTRSPQS